MEPDELLIKSALKGNQEAFRKIVESYKAFVYAICFNIAKDHQEAENLAQETFIQVYRSLAQFRSKGFKTWIGRIATNKALDWKRKRKPEILHTVSYMDELINMETGEVDQLYEQLAKKEDKEKLMGLFEELPEIYKVIIKKYYSESKSYKQISDEEGISIKTVESRLYRARMEIKRRWEEDEHVKAF